ncbi:CopY/TcrY family copper transport repressor [Marinilactibacillus sp. Marseille-P9653]|uniref:CopY/TcrY family copper transport repressor n=1 Tax=Marinilactibacillus sp. Marseille-P9653 TaxID=2866583 RepID=UPI001CE3EBD5|nr:CopY/TcrY family copper transport repressor [Marinilactibacillus sp. Marseille-P9653]
MIGSNISPSEWEVMRVVWAMKETTSNEIHSVLRKEMDWKLGTTKTVIGRLVKKGMLNTDLQGRHYIYTPAVTEKESVENEGRALLSQVCNKKAGSVIAMMVEDAEIGQEDIKVIEDILYTKRKLAPKEITCECIKGQCSCHHPEEYTLLENVEVSLK